MLIKGFPGTLTEGASSTITFWRAVAVNFAAGLTILVLGEL
jgi:hypothetical protein